jgi:hypothetical protein
MTIGYISCAFGNFVVICPLWYIVQRKSGNPGRFRDKGQHFVAAAIVVVVVVVVVVITKTFLLRPFEVTGFGQMLLLYTYASPQTIK